MTDVRQNCIEAAEVGPWHDELIRQLDALHAIAKPLSVNFGQHRLLQEVLATIERELGLERCTVMLLSPSGGGLIFEAAGDVTSDMREPVSYQRGEGVTGRVLATGHAAVVP